MKLIRNTLIFLCLISTLVFSFVSCGEKESLRLAADKTTAKHGEVVIFNTTHVTKKGEVLTDDVTYEITSGSENGTLEGNKLTIAATAKDNAVIKVVSKKGDLVSNEISVTVNIPENKLSISADKTVAQRGETVTINVQLTEDDKPLAAEEANLTITKGAEAATLVGTKLKIKDDAANGTEIELVATYKELTSNTVKVTVTIPVTGITASATKSFIPAGSFVTLQKTFAPVGAFGDVEWLITAGAEFCTVSGDMLAVNDNAPDGEIIKVKAKCGSVVSNELTFTVGDGTEESFLLLLSQSSLTVDRNSNVDTLLEVEIFDGDLQLVTDRTVAFEITRGSEYLTITQEGNVCYFEALGHGEATVRVSLPGTNVSKTAEVKVVVPPESIKLPEVFVERLNLAYNFSMIDITSGLADRLVFDAGVLGTNVCKDIKYTFVHEDGTTGEDVAVWADGKITFKKEGRVTLTVSSDSGSRNEVSASYSFEINKGYNVRNYSELKALLENPSYNGEIINVVVTEKPTGANG